MSGVSLDSLLALDGPDFIRSAYRLLLGREVDANGLDHFRKRLLNGADRAAVLYDLARSKEGRAFRANLPGLPKLLRRQRLYRVPLMGSLFLLAYTGLTKKALRRLNSVSERVHSCSSNINQPHQNSSCFWGEAKDQYLSKIMMGIVFRMALEEAPGAGIGLEETPSSQFNKILNSLKTDAIGRLLPIEAPEVFIPYDFDGHLPPRSLAILSGLG